jgi:hypothetical protein
MKRVGGIENRPESPPARRKIQKGKMRIRREPLRLNLGQHSTWVPSLIGKVLTIGQKKLTNG